MTTPRKTQKKERLIPIDFEQSLQQLNHLIEEMETGHLSLESSLKHFEEGVTLIRYCQQTLNDAEQKIQIIGNSSNPASKDFKPEDK